MIYEYRVYEAVVGKLPALSDRFDKITMGYFAKHDIKVVGFFTDVIGTSNQLTYILAFNDLAHRERAWANFAADQDRLKAFAETEANGPLVAKVHNSIWRPTAYSPMQ